MTTITARSALRKIEAKQSEIESQRSRLSRELRSVSSQFDEQTRIVLGAYQKIAEIYMPNLDDDNSIASNLRGFSREFDELSRQKDLKESRLIRLIDSKERDQRRTKEQLETKLDHLSNLEFEIGRLEKGIQEKLGGHSEYQGLIQRREELTNSLNSANDQFEKISELSQNKLSDYKTSQSFTYLLKSGFGTDDYVGSGFTKIGDNVLANLIGFEKAKEKYDILLEMPRAAEERVKSIKFDLAHVVEEMSEISDELELEEGLNVLRDELVLTEGEISGYKTVIGQTSTELHRYQRELRALESTGGEYHQKGVSKLVNLLQGRSIRELERMVTSTETLEDDREYHKILRANRKLKDLSVQKKELEQQDDSYTTLIRNFNLITEDFSYSGKYNGSRNKFRNIDIEEELDNFVSGDIQVYTFKRALEAAHFREPIRTTSYSSSSYSSSRRSSGYGGYSSSYDDDDDYSFGSSIFSSSSSSSSFGSDDDNSFGGFGSDDDFGGFGGFGSDDDF